VVPAAGAGAHAGRGRGRVRWALHHRTGPRARAAVQSEQRWVECCRGAAASVLHPEWLTTLQTAPKSLAGCKACIAAVRDAHSCSSANEVVHYRCHCVQHPALTFSTLSALLPVQCILSSSKPRQCICYGGAEAQGLSLSRYSTTRFFADVQLATCASSPDHHSAARPLTSACQCRAASCCCSGAQRARPP
jgi:hypothetical protein